MRAKKSCGNQWRQELATASHGRQSEPWAQEFLEDALAQRIERTTKKIGLRLALEFPVVGTWFYRKARHAGIKVLGDSEKAIRNGNWSGNDTCWRMALDLNRALLYGNPDGTWRERGIPNPT